MRAIRAALALAALLMAATAAPAAAQQPAACDPFTEPRFAGQVPTAKQVIGIDLGERDVTTAESDRYVRAIDAASDRVISGTLEKRSHQNRELVYAIAGEPQNVRSKGLAEVRESAAELMNPSTSSREAEKIARKDPAILWIASNVHGGEESGTDASLRVLYELADRTDCAARRIRDESIVVFLPIQNPDGREADARRNAYGFDMNRDWFARTQPETDAKVELLRRYPGPLFIDAHEMGNPAGYFFPPNADPIYHDIADKAIEWINDVYGAAMNAEFEERGIPKFNYAVYDMFYAGYGDTVPAMGFNSAGMTFEKTSGHPTPRRVFEQYLTQWISLSQAAINKDEILEDWHASWVEAKRQGEAGELEPNFTVEPDNEELLQQVPDMKVRHYFLRPQQGKAARAAVARPPAPADGRERQGAHALAARARLPALRPRGALGDAARRHDLGADGAAPEALDPVDAQREHLHAGRLRLRRRRLEPAAAVQHRRRLLGRTAGAARGDDAAPAGGGAAADAGRRRGRAVVDVAAVHARDRVRRLAALAARPLGRRVPRGDGGGHQGRRAGRAPTSCSCPTAGRSTTESGDPYGFGDLGTVGQQALTSWVSSGGRYVGWLDGGVLASAVGISTAKYEDGGDAGVSTPGSLFRARVDTGSPLAEGVGPFAYPLDDARYLMRAEGSRAVMRYPEAGSEDFFVSGHADGEEAMGGTAAAVDERFGSGRVVAFNFDPNFRAFTDGTQRMLRNAMFGPDPAATRSVQSMTSARAQARASTQTLTVVKSPLRLVVRARGEAAARRVLDSYGARYQVQRSPGRVGFVIANPGERIGDEHPYARELDASLREADVPVVLYRVP